MQCSRIFPWHYLSWESHNRKSTFPQKISLSPYLGKTERLWVNSKTKRRSNQFIYNKCYLLKKKLEIKVLACNLVFVLLVQFHKMLFLIFFIRKQITGVLTNKKIATWYKTKANMKRQIWHELSPFKEWRKNMISTDNVVLRPFSSRKCKKETAFNNG